jgi:hypothetical protein
VARYVEVETCVKDSAKSRVDSLSPSLLLTCSFFTLSFLRGHTHFRSRPYRLVHLLFHSTRLFFSYGVWSGLSVLGDEIFAFYTLLRLHRGVPVMAQFIGLSFFFLNISLLSSSLIVDIDLSSSLHCLLVGD